MEVQLADITKLLLDLKRDLEEARADIRWLKKKAGFGQKPIRKRAIITMPFTYEFDEPSIELCADDWDRVKRGETVKIKGKGHIICDEVTYCDYWEFNGGIGGTVKLDLGLDENDENPETAYVERLDSEVIDEFDEPRLGLGMDV